MKVVKIRLNSKLGIGNAKSNSVNRELAYRIAKALETNSAINSFNAILLENTTTGFKRLLWKGGNTNILQVSWDETNKRITLKGIDKSYDTYEFDKAYAGAYISNPETGDSFVPYLIATFTEKKTKQGYQVLIIEWTLDIVAG